MNLVKKVYRKICYIYFRIVTIIKIVIKSILYKNKIYLFGVPIHGNLGDQAILLAEETFLKDNMKNTKIIEIESSIVVKYQRILLKLVKNSVILVHGGGFLGSLWINEEEMFRTILKIFPDNMIIVFPQTIYFSNDDEGKKVLKESMKLYQSHKNLIICCREKFSYQFMKEKFPLCNIMLIPDMVLYLNSISNNTRIGTLFCIRQDREKVQYDLEKVKEDLKEIGNVDYTDTVITKNIYTCNNRKKYLYEKLNQFSQYKLIVTDRLHGMIFALLAGTPCLVFENKSYKVKGVYEWIKDVDYIKLYDEENVQEQIEQLLILNVNKYNNEKLIEKYKPLIEIIKENINKEKERNGRTI